MAPTPFDGPALPLRRVERDPHAEVDDRTWPFTIPAVRQVLAGGLELPAATILVGENGVGKSTVVEAIAMAYGMAPEGGSTQSRHVTFESESPLHESIRLIRGIGGPRWGYFIRGETLHGLFTHLHHSGGSDPALHQMSHGQAFSALLDTRRFSTPGLFVMDEPEAGLSFHAQLRLLVSLREMVENGAQVIIATHSPILASLPGATILQLDDEGMSPIAWDDLDVVNDYRRFLDAPQRYFRHLFAD